MVNIENLEISDSMLPKLTLTLFTFLKHWFPGFIVHSSSVHVIPKIIINETILYSTSEIIALFGRQQVPLTF